MKEIRRELVKEGRNNENNDGKEGENEQEKKAKKKNGEKFVEHHGATD